MDKLFIIKLAFRNLISHKMRTILTLTGVVIGISAVVFLISLSSGIQRLVTEQITGGDAFQLIDVGTGNSQVVKLDPEIVSKVSGISGIKSVETITSLGGKAKKGDNVTDVAFFGVSSPTYLDWSGKQVRYGENLPDQNIISDKILVNTSYLTFLTDKKPESMIGQKVSFDIILPKELSKTGEAVIFPDKTFTISGIIKDEASPSIYTNESNFTAIEPISYSQAKVWVNDRTRVEDIRKQIEAHGLKTEYVGDAVNQVQQIFGVFKIVLASFGVIALMVALLGMFNTLTISLLERIKEVALMKILGMGKKDVRNLFLTEAMSLGLVGGSAGIIWGMVVGKIANIILNTFAVRAGGDSVTIFYYTPLFIISIMLVAILVGFITGIYPAKRAATINALNVLKYE